VYYYYYLIDWNGDVRAEGFERSIGQHDVIGHHRGASLVRLPKGVNIFIIVIILIEFLAGAYRP
jgi:hypothetical protein